MSFYIELMKELLIASTNNYSYDENFDHERFGRVISEKITIQGRIRKRIESVFNKRGYVIILKQNFERYIGEKLELIEPYLKDLEIVYDQLSNGNSKTLLIKILAYRVLGFSKVKLPLNNSGFWDGIDEIKRLADNANNYTVKFLGWQLPLVDLHKKGIPIKLFFHPAGAYIDFILKQYEYDDGATVISAEKDDIVIDAGGCWGDTALFFANEVKSGGQVFSYEFIPSNLDLMRKNLSLNPDLEKRIRIIDKPVWEASNETIYYLDNGPGSKVFMEITGKYDGAVKTLSIDDMVESVEIKKVNFIKMDIEGAELSALKGAVQTIRRFKPKLAIAIYHSLDDMVDIPKFIHQLGLGYRLFLAHCSIHAEETILFAKTDS